MYAEKAACPSFLYAHPVRQPGCLDGLERSMVRSMRGKNWMEERKRSVYLRFLYALTLSGLLLLGTAVYASWWKRVPDHIRLRQGAVQNLEFGVPASGQIYAEKEKTQSVNAAGGAVTGKRQDVFLDSTVTFVAGESLSPYVMKLKLFGILPFKEVNIQVIPDEMIIPAGLPVGIYVRTNGVLVLDTGEFTGTSGQIEKPSVGILRSGDYILETDGRWIEGKEEFMETVESSNGEEMTLTIQRGEDIFDVRVEPKQTQSGEYKIGVWIRENAQGVGTLTYVKGDGSFGALGHGINDIDTSTLMNVESGSLYETEIIGIRKGENGVPGEVTGIIDYSPERKIGSIAENTVKGVFGSVDERFLQQAKEAPVRIGLKQEIHTGEAEIICSVTGRPEHYTVQIEEVHLEKEDVNRGIVLQVTDPKLLRLTGGIVQGMSGSPILQNGRIVGAVTHVFVNDPAKGYGIFIENMLEHD